MLTPRFEISQTDEEIMIIIQAPYANIKDSEVYVDGNDFRFYSTPYYLRLKLPGEIEENDNSSATYDCEKGSFTLKFAKVNVGELFENLDMITTLLAPPKKKINIGSNIEVIGNPANSENLDKYKIHNDNHNENFDTDSSNEWFVHQDIQPEKIIFLTDCPKYGFGNKVSGALIAFEEAWLKEVIDLPTPDKIPQCKRRILRERKELKDFNEEHYMADLMQPEYVEPYVCYEAEWTKLNKENIIFNKEEIDLLKELPNKEYLLNSQEVQSLLFNLVDILYGSCYNHRTTMGENTVESSWTINKLSSTLCWFQDFDSMDEAIRTCIRRTLCYPLFRNWNLAIKVFDDVKQVVKLGKKYIIKRLCEIHSLFNNSYEPRYLLNQLYIKDYLIWLQSLPESLIESMSPILDNIHPTKEDMSLELLELEEAAYSVQEEGLVIENSVQNIMDHIQNLKIQSIQNEKSSNISTLINDIDTDSENDSDSSSSSSSSTSNSTLDSDDTNDPQ